MRERKKKRIIIISMIGLLFVMASGYAAFRTNLDIKGTSSINSNWDIRITNVTEANKNGEAETVSTNFTDLTAYMEANLYNKGDYIEYDVTIENKGTFDAKLSDIITNVKSNNEAVLITFSGYTKGETLYKETSKIIKVRIEYNPEYEGEATGSGEIEVDFTYDQAEGGTIVPTDKYLVTYDCEANGGSDCTNYNEYLSEGSSINLTYQGTNKQYYDFVGWNTDKDAHEGLTSLEMGSNDITLYAIYEEIDATAPIIDSVNTTSTTNSITVVVSAHDAESGIVKYEYSIDGGKTWETRESNTYTFTGLTQGTEYEIKVRVTNEGGKIAEGSKSTATGNIEVPIYSSEEEGEVKISYPSGCERLYKCTYVKDGEEIEVSSNEVMVYFGESGSVVAKVSDGTNTVAASTCTVQRENFYVSNSGSDATGYGTINKPYMTIQKAYDSAGNNANIYVMNHLTMMETTNFNEDKKILLTSEHGENNVITRDSSFLEEFIESSLGQLTLKNITFDGQQIKANMPALNIHDSIFIMEDGTIIKNNNDDNDAGGGIRFNNATATINGGIITNNIANLGGGGGFLARSSNITINDVEISNNSGVNGGGIFFGDRDYTLTIKGGKFNNNVARSSTGGGVMIANSNLILAGGEITQNTAQTYGGGIYLGSLLGQGFSTFTMKTGTISQNSAATGGGIFANDSNNTLLIENGSISNNEATTYSGGGIYTYGVLTMSGGTISNNISYTYGGGIMCKTNCTVTGGTISGNTATTGTGGGIQFDGVFVLNGGTIKNNTANINGGIWLSSTGKYTYKSGIVCGNKPSNSYETSATCPS